MTSFAEPPGGAPTGDESRNVQVNLDANVAGYSQGINQAQQQTAGLAGSVDKLSLSLSGLSKFTGKQLIHFAVADFAGLGAGVADAASLERQLGTLRATSVVTGSSMGQMKQQLDQAFGSFPVARQQVIQLAETINSLGVTSPKAVGSMVNTFTKLGAATGESPIGLASSSIQLDRQLGNTDPGQVAGYANSLLTVSKNQGVAASGVLAFAQNIAPMARAAGVGEAAILGISAAFQKAGADGAYAAQAFNQIAGDITNLSQTGSPELAKYSNFVGKSTSQFRGESGTAQLTSVFDQIAKGGPQANSFVQSLGLGQRAVTSFQAVAQSGGISQAVAQAQGSATNTDNLDAASKSAFAGLSNSVISIGNEFTMLGEKIGDPLLKPIELLANGFGAGLKIVNGVVSAMGPLPGIAAALVGALAVPAGLALGHLGIVGGLALGRTVLGGKSAPRIALREGRAAGEAMFAGATKEDAMAASVTGRRIAAGLDPNDPLVAANRRMSMPYNYAMAAAARGPSDFEKAHGDTLYGAARARAKGMANNVMGAGTFFMDEQSRSLRDSRLPGPERSGNQPRPPGSGFFANVRGGGFKGAFRAGRTMVQETVDAAGSMAASGVGSLIRAGEPGLARRAVADVGGLAARGAGNLFRGASAVAGAAFGTPLGLLATTIGAPLIGGLISSIKSSNAEKADVSGSLTGVAKYDQFLDKSSTNLARFGQSVDVAANRLAGFASTPIKQLANVTGSDVSAVQGSGYKTADGALKSVVDKATDSANGPLGDKDAVKKAALGYLDATGIQAGSVTGDNFTKYKQDLLSTMGVDKSSQVTDIMKTFAGQVNAQGGLAQNSSFGDLAGLAATANRQGGSGELTDFKNIFGSAVGGLTAATQDSGNSGVRSKLANLLSMGAVATGTGDIGQGDRLTAFSSYMNQAFGVDANQFSTAVGDAGAKQKTSYISQFNPALSGPYSSQKDALPALVNAFAATDAGRKLMTQQGLTIPQLLKMAQDPGALPAPAANETATQLATHGPLGQYLANPKTGAGFQQATTGNLTGDAGAGFAAAQNLVGESARQVGGDMSTVTANLMTLSDAMGGASAGPTAALIKSAADWARQLQSFQMPTLSREDQLATTNRTARNSAAAAALPGASKDTVAQSQQDKNAFESQKESYRQSMIGRIVQVKEFGVQQGRAVYDQNVQIAHSNRDFGEQQANSEFDFNTQRARSEMDFGVQQARAEQDNATQRLRSQQDYQQQSQRSAEDYQLNVSRQNADHMRDLARQAQAASQDIYNPFIREQTKATTDAGTLIYNLTQQNSDIEKQMAQIADLKKKGVSQQTIDTLNLTTADNAQQVNTLDKSLGQNPNMVGRINSLVGKRVAGTTALTQNPDSLAFRQSQADYQQGQQRASQDFTKSQSRAAADYQKAAQRMDADFAKSQARAGEDQSKTLGRMSSDFAVTQARAVFDHQKALSDMAVSFKLMQDRAAADLVTSFTQYAGSFGNVFAELGLAALGPLATLAPAASKLIMAEMDNVAAHEAALLAAKKDPLISGGAPYGGTSTATPDPLTSGGRPINGFAFGGISMTQQIARVSENGPELHLPLNGSGQDFMTGLITKSLAQAIIHTITSIPAATTSMSHDNSVSFAGAQIRVEASDPNKMAKDLQARAKLARLASPVRH